MKRFICVIIILITLLCFGCNKNMDSDTLDGEQFSFLTEKNISKTENIKIYKIDNIKDVYYTFEKIEKPICANWIMNYIYTYNYLYDGDIPDSLFDEMSTLVTDNLKEYENQLGIEFKVNKDGFQEEREENIIIEEFDKASEVLMIDLHIPYRIEHIKDQIKNTYIIMIPVHTFFGVRQDDKLIFNDQTYDYNLFINENVAIKNNL